MTPTPEKPAPSNADSEAVQALFDDPGLAAKALPEVAALAVDLAQRQSRPDVLWALSSHPSRAVGKSARRALHLLRSRGVEVGERPRPPLVKVATAEPEVALPPCRATAIDGFGDRALWLPMKAASGVELWQFVLSDEAGVRLGQRVDLSRRQLRAHFQELAGQEALLSEMPRERAAALLAEAMALGGEPPALSLAREVQGRLGAPDLTLAKPLSMGAPPLPPPEETARRSESAELFEERALQTYVPAEAVLRELAARLDEVDVSPLALDERQKAERRRRVLEDATAAYFTPAVRARMARRLFELVDIWTEQGRSLSAARAAAAARHLAGGAPALENPFARRLFERIFARDPEAPVAPQGSVKTPGGLILPPG